MIDLTKFEDYRRNIYYSDWTYTDARVNYDNVRDILEKPKKSEEMLHIAEILSKDFLEVRVDLYCVNEDAKKIYFGEFTFYHGGGDSGEFTGKFEKEISEAFVFPE